MAAVIAPIAPAPPASGSIIMPVLPLLAAVTHAALALAGDPPPTSAEHAGSGTLIVLNKSDATASVLERATGRALATLPTGAGPHEVAVSPDGRTAVVADYGARTPGSTLTVIDLPKLEVVRTIDLGPYQRPHGIVFVPGGDRVVVTAEAQKRLLVVDVAAGEVTTAVDTTQEISHMVVITPDGKRAFVSNIRSGSVTAIDLEQGALLSVIPTGDGAEGIDLAPDGGEVWVSNRGADTLTVIDAESLEVTETLACGSFPIRLKFTPGGEHVLVSNARSGDVAVFEASSRRLLRRITMEVTTVEAQDDRLFGTRFEGSPVPVGILVTPDGREAFVANTNADAVTVIDLGTWKISRRLTAGHEPDGLAFSPLAPR